MPFLFLSISQKVWKADKKYFLRDRKHKAERIPDGNIGDIYSTHGSNWKMSFREAEGEQCYTELKPSSASSLLLRFPGTLCVNKERRKKKCEENSLYN